MTTVVEEFDTIIGSDTIEGIDFDLELNCEAWFHADSDSHAPHLKIRFDCACDSETEFWCNTAWHTWPSLRWDTVCMMSPTDNSHIPYHSLENGLLVPTIIGTL